MRTPKWFWTWAEWRLGRGKFKGHANDPRRRPRSAPRRIPAWAWAKFAALFVTHRKPAPRKPTPSSIREAIVAYCRWGIANEPAIHYAQVRPMPIHATKTLPMRTDCSGFATLAYRVAGAPDPNGAGFNGTGYTGTMLAHGRRVAKAKAKRGDLAVFGPAPGHHVVVLLEDGRVGDPLVASHGQERGPIALRLSEEARYQPTPITFLTYLEG